MTKQKIALTISGILTTILALPAVALAHVVVTPAQAVIGARTLFTVSVPNEKQVAVTAIELRMPKGIQDVQPNVTAGWHITTVTDDDGNVTSITWQGTIPVGQRADLLFKAQTPAAAGELDWKANQTYADGSVVHWDQNAAQAGKAVKDDVGPYSVTKVIDDEISSKTSSSDDGLRQARLALAVSIAALVLSIGSLFMRRPKR